MKKILLTLILFFYFSVCFAATVDTNPPVLENLELASNTFKLGGEMKLLLTAYDDVSGITSAFISFKKVDGLDEAKFFLDCYGVEPNITCTERIPNNISEGTYKINYFSLRDRNNHTLELREDELAVRKFDHQFKLSGVDTSKNPPIMTSLTINKNEFVSGEEVILTANITPVNGEVNSVIAYYDGPKELEIFFEKAKGNIWIGKIKADELKGKYTFRSININDVNSNYIIYSYKNVGSSNFNSSPTLTQNLDIKRTDITIDNEYPELVDVKFTKTKINTPGTFQIVVTVKNNTKIKNISYLIENKNHDSDLNYFWSSSDETTVKGNVITSGVIDVDQYVPADYYKLTSLSIEAENGNVTHYLFDYLCGQDHCYVWDKEIGITITNDKSDVTTSTTSNTLIDKIKESKDGSIIAIDVSHNTLISKDVFEAIKGTNKTIKMEFNGIVWEFYGKNIKNPKDIDVNVNAYLLENYQKNKHLKKRFRKALVIEFMENGELPGKAKISIKASYTFRNYIGIEHLKLYYNKQNDNYDLVSKGIVMNKKGYYEFYINHNSSYILTEEEIDQNYIVNDQSTTLGNDNLNKTNQESIKDLSDKEKEELINSKDDILDNIEDNTEEIKVNNNTDSNDDDSQTTENKNINYPLIISLSITTIVIIGIVVLNYKFKLINKLKNKIHKKK